jgi:hypothetical protein
LRWRGPSWRRTACSASSAARCIRTADSGHGSGEVRYGDTGAAADAFDSGSDVCVFISKLSTNVEQEEEHEGEEKEVFRGARRYNILARSSAEHLLGTQLVMLSWIWSRPVVHWHLVSVRLQPEAGTAVAKQAIYIIRCQYIEGHSAAQDINLQHKSEGPGDPARRQQRAMPQRQQPRWRSASWSTEIL